MCRRVVLQVVAAAAALATVARATVVVTATVVVVARALCPALPSPVPLPLPVPLLPTAFLLPPPVTPVLTLPPCCQFLSGAEHATCSHKTTRDAARTGLATASQHNVVYFSSRTNYIDNKVKGWIAQGFEQVVVVAAGFDSRAYRIPLNGSFFELDMPSVIAEKITKVAELGLNTTGTSVGYVPADLRVKTAEQALRATPGFDATKKTVYVVEGLIYYLHQDDVDKLFESLGKRGRGAGGRQRLVVGVLLN